METTDLTDLFATLTTEAKACRVVLEDIAMRAYAALAVLEEEFFEHDWIKAKPLLDALAGIALIATAPGRDFARAGHTALRVVQ